MAITMTGVASMAQTQLKGYEKENMDTDVRPGNDFRLYAAGKWIESHPLDAEHTSNGAFTDLYDRNEKQIQELIGQFASTPQKKGTLGYKIGTLYNLMMDSVRLNNDGYAPIMPALQRVRDIKDVREYQRVTAELHRKGSGNMMFGIGVGSDMRQADQNLVYIAQGGLGLGTPEYYLNNDPQTKKIREAYQEYYKTLFTLVGYDAQTAEKKVQNIMAIEERIAKESYDKVKQRDINANYHKMSYAQLLRDFPGIDWTTIFWVSGFPAFDYVDMGQPEPLHEVERILADTPLENLKDYAEGRVINSAASILSDNFREAAFTFSSIMSGQKADKPRWKRATGLVNSVMSDAIGQMYCEKYFPQSSKQRMLDIVGNLQTALSQRINEATWMSAETKQQAQDKLSNFIVKIGYPDKWRDYTALEVTDTLSLYENLCNINEFFTLDELRKKVGKPVDKTEWLMSPQTINAYYNPTTNEICFPAGILQPPFFDPLSDDALNYGAIGAVIGHEMSHGFDDQGSQFDKYGNQNDWWTPTDKKNFEARTKVLVDYFSAYEALPGKKINGKLTLGENIGDNGGLNISFRALQNVLKENPTLNKSIDGFTPEQRFFLSWATVWAGNARPEFVDRQIKTDPHSPAEARVNGALPQIDAWYKAFNIKKSDKLFVPQKKRAQIW